MRTRHVIAVAALVAAAALAAFWPRGYADGPAGDHHQNGDMHITSSAFADGERMPRVHTCDAEDVSPALEFTDVPSGAASLVLIVDDPDAPVGTWTHWTAWNIPPDATGVPYGSAPKDAVEGSTSFGSSGYGGPCPPSGTHRYFFRLFALDTDLDLGPEADVRALRAAMQGHVIAEATLMGTYSREP